jgi:hypothetical protein
MHAEQDAGRARKTDCTESSCEGRSVEINVEINIQDSFDD